MSNYDAALKAEAKRVKRCWQSSSVESWTIQASANLKYRAPLGHYYYVHPDLPGVSFRKRAAAAEAALSGLT